MTACVFSVRAHLWLRVFLNSFSIVNAGNFQLINGTCAHQDTTRKTMRAESRCPNLRPIEMVCSYNKGSQHYTPSPWYLVAISSSLALIFLQVLALKLWNIFIKWTPSWCILTLFIEYIYNWCWFQNKISDAVFSQVKSWTRDDLAGVGGQKLTSPLLRDEFIFSLLAQTSCKQRNKISVKSSEA